MISYLYSTSFLIKRREREKIIMAKFILNRILMMIPVLLGITIIVFTLMYLTPGDPALSILGETPRRRRSPRFTNS